MSSPEIRFDENWTWATAKMPDLLASTDVMKALREESLPGNLNLCYRRASFSIDEHAWLPSGTILGCTERGREFVREMNEAEVRKKENGREWMWRSLYGAWR